MRLGLDYAGGRPDPQAIRAAGFDFVVRYLSDGGAGLPGKLLTPDEADRLRAAGVDIVSNWETTADRMLDGYDAGVYDATAARAQVRNCGGRDDRPIVFSADFDATEEQQGPINDYLRGANSVLGVQNTGIYAGYWVVKRALDAGVATWGWQTDAWSGGNVDPRIQLHQRIQQVWVDGVPCDVSEALADDFGQWSYDAAPEHDSGGEEVDQTFFTGYMGNVVSDLKDAREQLTGSRDRIDNPDGSVNEGESYPGWPQLGNRTLIDAVAYGLGRIEAVAKTVEALAGKLGVDITAAAPAPEAKQ